MMLIILKYPISHHQKYDNVNIARSEAEVLLYEHINSDSTVEGLSITEVFTFRVNKTTFYAIPIRQNFVRLKP